MLRIDGMSMSLMVLTCVVYRVFWDFDGDILGPELDLA